MHEPENAPDLPNVVRVGNLSAAPATITATARTRMNFSVQHLLVAARLAREVLSTERDNTGAPLGSFYDVVLGSSVGCIMLSTAAAEAYANELFADRSKHFKAHDQTILDLLWEQYEQKSVLDKFDLAIRLRIGTSLDRGTPWVQSFDRLIKLRNGLTHFKPEWFDEQEAHLRLSRQLEGFVSRSPWIPSEPLFPRAWATAETTSWAIDTIVTFIDHFSETTGITNRILKFKDRLDIKSI